MRQIMGLLDATMCEWIKQRSGNTRSLVASPVFDVPIEKTHLFTLRLFALSENSTIEDFLRAKVHSLVVFSGIMMSNSANGQQT